MHGANWETEVPAGYTAVTGLLEPDTTVGGALARGEEIKGFCGQRGCTRRCTIDLQRLVAKGFGSMQLSFVRDLWRCHSLTGCGFDLRTEQSTGIFLRELIGRSHVRVRVKCAKCGFFRSYLVEKLLAQLSARQTVSHTPQSRRGPRIHHRTLQGVWKDRLAVRCALAERQQRRLPAVAGGLAGAVINLFTLRMFRV